MATKFEVLMRAKDIAEQKFAKNLISKEDAIAVVDAAVGAVMNSTIEEMSEEF